MVEIGAGGWRRGDVVTTAAVVLTVDAVLMLVIAAVGAPFVLSFFADGTGTWGRLWPLVTGWLAAGAFGLFCARTAVRFTRSGPAALRTLSRVRLPPRARRSRSGR